MLKNKNSILTQSAQQVKVNEEIVFIERSRNHMHQSLLTNYSIIVLIMHLENESRSSRIIQFWCYDKNTQTKKKSFLVISTVWWASAISLQSSSVVDLLWFNDVCLFNYSPISSRWRFFSLVEKLLLFIHSFNSAFHLINVYVYWVIFQ